MQQVQAQVSTFMLFTLISVGHLTVLHFLSNCYHLNYENVVSLVNNLFEFSLYMVDYIVLF